MKSLVDLWTGLAAEAAEWCRTSTTRDVQTLTRRVNTEGDSFLTITLAAYGKAFDQCLDRGRVENASFPGFSRVGRGPLPKFLGGFLSQVFDSQCGTLLPSPNVEAIRAVRQLCFLFAKIERPCAVSRVKAAFQDFVDVEMEVERWSSGHDDELTALTHGSMVLFSDVLSDLDRKVWEGALKGKHGPGATAEKLSANGKYSLEYYPARLEREFPALFNVLPSPHYWGECDRFNFADPDNELPVRVIQVPKTLKTPRIIAIEPAAMQFAQQAVSTELTSLLESRFIGLNRRRNLCHGMIGFTDQQPNQLMACEGSLSGSLATLDLSAASDRVSNLHVMALLANFPWLSRLVQACRSTKADVPGHGVIPLSKFASMGSALCFPLEAMAFLTMVFLGIAKYEQQPLTRGLVNRYRGCVRVYGDDIIVPTHVVQDVIESLEAFGLVVNRSKSFWTGKFRESCGGDFYDGQDVTPVRLKREIPQSRRDSAEMVTFVSFRNNLYLRGYWKTCGRLDDWIGKRLRHYPAVADTSPILGRLSFLGYDTQREHRRLHAPLVKGYRIATRIPVDPVDDWPALMKFHLKRSEEPLPDGHLHRQGRPLAVDIKLGWAQPF